MKYKVLDLFSGIGGFSLGLEKTGGFETVAFCEIEEYPRKILAKHWPNVPCYGDIRELTADILERDGIAVDVICGGFPCQDVSLAGNRAGLDGERSGLWGDYRRLVGELRPAFVIVENTPGLLSLGMGTVLGDLAALGYDAEWHCVSAAAVGADHIRDRIWIIAYTDAHRELQQALGIAEKRRRACNGTPSHDADAHRAGRARWMQTGAHSGNVVSIFGPRLRSAFDIADNFPREHWDHQPVLGRRVHGIPNRLDRVGALGNAVVPQIPELIGRAILAAEAPQ